ncbi:MAG: VTT domain-containing protein [Thermodesulfobacteriota bacterium]
MTRVAAPPPAPAAAAHGERPLWRRALAARGTWTLIALLAASVALMGGLEALGGAAALRERWGAGAGVVLVGAQAITGIWPVPASEMLALANGALYGFWLGALLNWVGWMIASVLHYAMFRQLARDFDLEHALATLPAWLTRFPVAHPAFQILGRLVPLPAAPQVVGCASGALGVPPWRYLWCAAVGVAPGALLFSGLANGLLAG